MFLVKPEELKTLEVFDSSQLEDIVTSLVWAYVPWEQYVSLESLYVGVMVSVSFGQVKGVLCRLPELTFNLDSQLRFEVLEVLSPLKFNSSVYSKMCFISRPNEQQQLIAVGSYKPVFEKLREWGKVCS